MEIDTMNTTKTVKITKADRLTALAKFLSDNPDMKFPTPKGEITAQDMGKFVAHELELLSKKNSADKKPTAQQTANEAIKTAIVDGMEVNRLYTITELIKEIPECADMTNQRVSALVRQLVDAGLVKRIEDKRKAYFSLA
jgi:hypothetical protein